MKKLSLPFIITLFTAGALVHKGLAKKSFYANNNNSTKQVQFVQTEKQFSLQNSSKHEYGKHESSFSIHKIVAHSNVYYELHLERNGKLETWKISKGPSSNNALKKNALKKEDLPLDYLLFEGVVVSKEKVSKEGILVWDYGTYIFSQPPTADQYIIMFNGKRVKGLYVLEKTHLHWTLTKQEDEFADTHKNITRLFTRSALSDLTITQILRHNTLQKKE